MSGIEDTAARRATLATTIPYYEFREVLSPIPAGKIVIDLVRIFPVLPTDKKQYAGICW